MSDCTTSAALDFIDSMAAARRRADKETDTIRAAAILLERDNLRARVAVLEVALAKIVKMAQEQGPFTGPSYREIELFAESALAGETR